MQRKIPFSIFLARRVDRFAYKRRKKINRRVQVYDNCANHNYPRISEIVSYIFPPVGTTFQDKTASEHLARKHATIVDFRHTRRTRDSYPLVQARINFLQFIVATLRNVILLFSLATRSKSSSFTLWYGRYHRMEEARSRYRFQFSNG